MEFFLVTIGAVAAVISAYLGFLSRRDVAPCIGKIHAHVFDSYIAVSVEVIAARTECSLKSLSVKGMLVSGEVLDIRGSVCRWGTLHLVQPPEASSFASSLPLGLSYTRDSFGSSSIEFVCKPADSSIAVKDVDRLEISIQWTGWLALKRTFFLPKN